MKQCIFTEIKGFEAEKNFIRLLNVHFDFKIDSDILFWHKKTKLSGIQVKHHLKEKVYYLIFYPLLLWTKDEKKEYDQTEGALNILSD